mgnify:CR=1
MANPVPPATFDGGRATPPPPPGFPPKFTPEIYEEVRCSQCSTYTEQFYSIH